MQWTWISLYWLQFFCVLTTELEGLLWYPVIFTGSLQGRITTQGDPCNLYRERVCSEYAKFICLEIFQYTVRLIETKKYFCNSTFNRTVRLIESTEYGLPYLGPSKSKIITLKEPKAKEFFISISMVLRLCLFTHNLSHAKLSVYWREEGLCNLVAGI